MSQSRFLPLLESVTYAFSIHWSHDRYCVLMTFLSKLQKGIDEILSNPWERRDANAAPEPQEILLGNHAVDLKATVLFADAVDSTSLVQAYNDRFAAAVLKSYLLTASELIRNNGGLIASFQGDRVMGIFIGKATNAAAAKCALQINHVVSKEINPRIKTKYPNSSFELKHAVGIDTSKLLVTRAGVWDSNDLVWIGRAASIAAKLCSLRSDSYVTFITSDVFEKLSVETKLGGNPMQIMWSKFVWEEYAIPAYKSAWRWSPG